MKAVYAFLAVIGNKMQQELINSYNFRIYVDPFRKHNVWGKNISLQKRDTLFLLSYRVNFDRLHAFWPFYGIKKQLTDNGSVLK
jgi:hypothetical protein